MSRRVSASALWLFVINLGIAFGAGLYEHRIVLSTWIDRSAGGAHWNPEAARRDDTGRRFWVYVTTIPLTLVTLANLIAATRAQGTLRSWWLAASGAALADRLFTFSYFIPTMIGLVRLPDSAEAVASATRWAALNHVRHAIVLAAWLSALKAFAVFHQQRE